MTQEIEKIWPEWKVVERIGSGAYGSVYKAVRSDHNLTSSAAIKVISASSSASGSSLTYVSAIKVLPLGSSSAFMAPAV